MTSPSVSVALRRITHPLRGLAFLTVNNNNKYSYYKFVILKILYSESPHSITAHNL